MANELPKRFLDKGNLATLWAKFKTWIGWINDYLPKHTLAKTNVPLVTNGSGKAKWATDTIGSDVKPIFLNGGKFTASSGNKGSSIKPIYFENGEIKETDANIGRANTPICMSNGNLIECTSINEAAYKGVANAITASLDELVPSYYIKTALDAINTKIGKEHWVLVGNAKQYGRHSSNNVVGWRGSVSVYKIYYLQDDGSSYSPDEYIILGCIEIPASDIAVDYGFYLELLPDTYNNLFPIPEITKDNDNVAIAVSRQNVTSANGIRIGFDPIAGNNNIGNTNLGTVKFCIRNKFPINKTGSWNILPTV